RVREREGCKILRAQVRLAPAGTLVGAFDFLQIALVLIVATAGVQPETGRQRQRAIDARNTAREAVRQIGARRGRPGVRGDPVVDGLWGLVVAIIVGKRRVDAELVG